MTPRRPGGRRETVAPRLLWHSVVPWSSSAYGGQTRMIARALRRHGVDVILSAGVGLHDRPIVWDGFSVVPSPGGRASAGEWFRQLLDPENGDRVITLMDAWRLADQRLDHVPGWAWTTFETVPAGERGMAALDACGLTPVAVSDFVAGLIETAGRQRPPVIRHGIDTTVFAPLVSADRVASRSTARRALGLDEASFVIGMVATNAQAHINRKSLPEVVVAAASFAEQRPNCILWIHTEDPSGRRGGGTDLAQLAATAGLRPERLRISPGEGSTSPFDDAEMSRLYNAFDVLCQPSGGEGFCLPLVEAQSCGIPVIASDFSAQPENVGVGRLVSGRARWVNELGCEMFLPSIDGIIAALDEIARAADDRFADACRFGARYDAEICTVDPWLDLLGITTFPPLVGSP